MGMDKLKSAEFFPDPQEGESFEVYMPRLLRWLEKELWYKISKRINFLLDTVNDGNISLASDGIVHFGDEDTNGTWRLIRSGNNWNMERRESGTWVKKAGATA